jgi:nucleoside-diphosphate-sugar epimerase
MTGRRLGRVLVTGASGFVGKALVSEMLRLGFSVTAATRGQSLDVACPVVRIERYDEALPPLDAYDCIVHLAARVHITTAANAQDSGLFRLVNVQGTLHLARAAAAAGVRRFVYLSSVKVNGESTLPGKPYTESDMPDPQDAYGLSKLEAEVGLRAIAAETDMQVVIIRPPLVYGPGVKANFAALISLVRRVRVLPLGAIRNRRSMVALDNLVHFILTCVLHSRAANETFLVSDGHDLSTPDLVRGLSAALGVRVYLPAVPVWLLGAGARVLGRPGVVPRLAGSLQVDISRARELLAWTPPVSVQEGLQRAVGPEVVNETLV